MANHGLDVRFASLTLMVLLFSTAPTFQQQKATFDMSRVKENWHLSHKGTPISQIGLGQKEVSTILSKVGVDAKAVLAWRVDMGEGGENGLVVQGNDDLCGATGNCQTWFFRKVDRDWQPLTGDWGPDPDTLVAAFAFLPPKHNGLDELVIVTHPGRVEVWWYDKAKQKYLSNDVYCWQGNNDEAIEGKCR